MELVENSSPIGTTVVAIASLNEELATELGWEDEYEYEPGTVILLSDGSMFVASSDHEGNYPGVVWHLPKDRSYGSYCDFILKEYA